MVPIPSLAVPRQQFALDMSGVCGDSHHDLECTHPICCEHVAGESTHKAVLVTAHHGSTVQSHIQESLKLAAAAEVVQVGSHSRI